MQNLISIGKLRDFEVKNCYRRCLLRISHFYKDIKVCFPPFFSCSALRFLMSHFHIFFLIPLILLQDTWIFSSLFFSRQHDGPGTHTFRSLQGSISVWPAPCNSPCRPSCMSLSSSLEWAQRHILCYLPTFKFFLRCLSCYAQFSHYQPLALDIFYTCLHRFDAP